MSVVATVLVVAADPSIEALVGELIGFAGHRPVFDATTGAAGESVRRTRSDIAMVDTALPRPVLLACLEAVVEVRSSAVLMSSTASAQELADSAQREGCRYFVLPSGPRQLRRVLEDVLHDGAAHATIALPPRLSSDEDAQTVHPAMCAALAGVARARMLAARADRMCEMNNVLRERRDRDADSAARVRWSRSALRAVVTDFMMLLRGRRVPEAEAVTRLRNSVTDCSAIIGTDSLMGGLLLESEHWAREVYSAH